MTGGQEKPMRNKEAGSESKKGGEPVKRPYSRPVLFVIGKIGQIFSNN
jgi:hypothetical protein